MNKGYFIGLIIKMTLTIAMITLFILPFSYASDTLRCGNDIIKTGESAGLVERKVNKCGEILSRSNTKKEIHRDVDNSSADYVEVTKTTEDWYVIVDGYCYDFKFEDNRLVEIGDFQRCE